MTPLNTKIPKQKVIQDFDHDKYVSALFRSIIDACNDEFHEDNAVTILDFCDECYEKAKEDFLKKYMDKCRGY